ncbi:Spo0B domain-containing protein [Alkalihalobacillus sp. 1P02AB]|uniref:Spo0B domain-containing protein n=1 Tax=Alkalihalobacillus sp. 1P02AB TaxID=3132260 RepID=UPI0039A76618
MTNDMNLLEALRHKRHDWLNIVQLIKMNLALGRYERIEELIHTTVQQCVNESKLSNLGISKLAEDLITYNWKNEHHNRMQLEINVAGSERDLHPYEPILDKVIKKVIFTFAEQSEWVSENQLLLTIVLNENECELLFLYEGTLNIKKADLFVLLESIQPKIEVVEWQKDTCLLKASVRLN